MTVTYTDKYRYRGVGLISTRVHIPKARKVGLIIQDALVKQVTIKWVWHNFWRVHIKSLQDTST